MKKSRNYSHIFTFVLKLSCNRYFDFNRQNSLNKINKSKLDNKYVIKI